MKVDVLAVGAHPDDVELGVGATLHKLAHRGYKVGILDLTRGEMSTRGTVEEREVEGQNAADILGVAHRANADLPDGGIANTQEQRLAVVPWLRRFRPDVLIVPMGKDRHPDHAAAHRLLRDANYLAGLAKIETDAERHRVQQIYYFHPYHDDTVGTPLVVDVSEHFDAKLEALQAHRSQFFNPDYEGQSTLISSKSFWESIRVRGQYWGQRIRTSFGEPLWFEEPVGVDLPLGLK